LKRADISVYTSNISTSHGDINMSLPPQPFGRIMRSSNTANVVDHNAAQNEILIVMLRNLADARKDYLDRGNNTNVESIDQLILRNLRSLDRFRVSTSSMAISRDLFNLSCVAQKLGCEHDDEESEKGCKFAELHEMISGKVIIMRTHERGTTRVRE
ncbi:MAG: hypothetical protein Q9218_008090, partial [Villophora microphyllina]